jgi:hypothetical protein
MEKGYCNRQTDTATYPHHDTLLLTKPTGWGSGSGGAAVHDGCTKASSVGPGRKGQGAGGRFWRTADQTRRDDKNGDMVLVGTSN